MWPCPCNYHASPILAAFADPSPPSNATLSTIAITRSNNLPFSKLSAAIQQSQLSYDLYLIARQLYFYFFSSSLSFRSRIFLRSKKGNVVHRRKFPRLFTMLVTSLFDEGTISKLNDIGDAIEGLRDRGSNKRLSPISTRERELSLLQRSAFRVSLPREINDTWKTDYRATLFHRSSSIYSLGGISRFGSDTRANWIPLFDSLRVVVEKRSIRPTTDSSYELHWLPSSLQKFSTSFPLLIAILSDAPTFYGSFPFFLTEGTNNGSTAHPFKMENGIQPRRRGW